MMCDIHLADEGCRGRLAQHIVLVRSLSIFVLRSNICSRGIDINSFSLGRSETWSLIILKNRKHGSNLKNQKYFEKKKHTDENARRSHIHLIFLIQHHLTLIHRWSRLCCGRLAEDGFVGTRREREERQGEIRYGDGESQREKGDAQ